MSALCQDEAERCTILFQSYTKTDVDHLEYLGRSRNEVVIFLSWHKGFQTSLNVLDEDGRLKILVVANHVLPFIVHDHLRRFAVTVVYDAGVENKDQGTEMKLQLYGTTGSAVVIPELYTVVAWVAGFFDAGKIAITTNEETTIYTVATLRQDLNVKGMSVEEATAFLDKFIMTGNMRKTDISVPETVSIGPMEAEKWPLLQQKVLDGLRFPLIVKPQYGAGSFGVKRLPSLSDVKRWFQKAKLEFPSLRFILQEYLVGPLISPSFVATNQELKMVTVTDYPSTYLQMIEEGAPAIGMMVDKESLDLDMDGIVRKIMDAFYPIPDGCYHAEGIVVPGRGWTFVELAARPEGSIASKVTELATGIDFEGLQLLGAPASITDLLVHKYAAHCNPQGKKCQHFAYMNYPQRPGKVLRKNDPNDTNTITSHIRDVSWSVDKDSSLVVPQILCHTVSEIIVENDNSDALLKDVLYLKDHYYPVELE